MRTTYWNVPASPTSRSQFGSSEILIAARSVETLTDSCGSAAPALLAAVRSATLALGALVAPAVPGLVVPALVPAVPALAAPALVVPALVPAVPALVAPAALVPA